MKVRRVLLASVALYLLGCQGKGPQTISDSNKALFQAIRNGDLTAAQTSVKAGANVNFTVGAPGSEVSPLAAALAFQRKDISLYLLANGAHTRGSYNGYSSADLARFAWGWDSDVLRAIAPKGALR